MKIIYFGQEEWEKEYITSKLVGHEVDFYLGSLQNNPTVTDTDAEVVSIFVSSHIGAEEMDHFPKLKLIATRSTGFDHVDIAEAKKRGIIVASVPSYGVNTVAEFAFALLLALSRRICEASERVRGGSFSQKDLEGFDLAGKTIGIVGMGHIGVHAVRMAHGFDMNVLAFDAHQDESLAQSLGFKYVQLPELLGASDIISIHVPYFQSTHHLINMQNINTIKRGAYLINTARGAVVETAALVQALKDGIIAGAGLDVLEEEGDMADEMKLLAASHPSEEELRIVLENHYLMLHPRVIITPHVAFDTREAIMRILDTAAGNITSFASGKLENVVG